MTTYTCLSLQKLMAGHPMCVIISMLWALRWILSSLLVGVMDKQGKLSFIPV